MAGNMLTNGLRALIHGRPGEYMFFTDQLEKKPQLQDLDLILLECSTTK